MFETLVVITKVVSGGVERQGGMTEAARERGREREREARCTRC
jgi:DNA-binding phage protein